MVENIKYRKKTSKTVWSPTIMKTMPLQEWHINGLESVIDVPLCIQVAVDDDHISVQTSVVMPLYNMAHPCPYLTSLTQSS